MISEQSATCELIELGLELISQQAPTIPAEDIHAWILSPGDELSFPTAEIAA